MPRSAAQQATGAPTVLVFGGSSGVGAAVRELLSSDYRILNVDLTDAPNGQTVRFDLRDIDALGDLLPRLPQSLDAIVYSAGVPGTHSPEDILSVNAVAPAALSDALLHRLTPGASIVFVGSVSTSNHGLPESDIDELLSATTRREVESWSQRRSLEPAKAYELSKALIDRLTETLSARLLESAIRVNCVKPGPVDTPLLEEFRESMGRRKIDGALRLVGRHASPYDVAEVIRFLVRPEAAWVNGALVPVDGGLMTALRVRRRRLSR